MTVKLALRLAVLLGALILPGAAIALTAGTTITVNTIADSTGGPDCTLRDAITAANTDAATGGCNAGHGADTIDFSVSGQINLGTTLPTVASHLTIDGSDQDITVSGQGAVRVLELSAAASLTLDGLTIADGAAANAGGILNEGALLVENSTLSHNQVVENFGAGAGIWNTAGGRLIVTNSSFSDNGRYTSGLGGGVYNDGKALVQNATFSGGGAEAGGGIFNAAGGRLAISHSTFVGNIADPGGAIDNSGTTLSIAKSSFLGNFAEFGGAIFSRTGTTLIISDSVLSGNASEIGGAIVSAGTVMVARSTFSKNDSDSGGGIASGSSLFVTDSTFANNSARGGGGIEASGEVTVSNSTFVGNSASDGEGGGIRSHGRLTLRSSTLVGNSASIAGGGIDNDGTATLANTIVAGSTNGGNCSGLNAAGRSNMADDPTCGPAFTQVGLADLKLGPLGDNGGPTQTIALGSGSVAINAGNNAAAAGLITDQRGKGFPRIVNGRVDIGAFEVQRRASAG